MSLSLSSAFRLLASGAFRPASGHSLLSNLAVSFSFSDEDDDVNGRVRTSVVRWQVVRFLLLAQKIGELDRSLLSLLANCCLCPSF